MVRYFKPETLPELLMLLNDKETQFPILAGGTDILVQWRMNSFAPDGIIDIGNIEELKLIVQRENVIEIGALVPHAAIASSKIVQRDCPVLAQACKTVGAVQIQNRGTIGGNIVTASPAADTPPVLMAFNAKVELKSLSGTRHIPIKDFYISYRKTALKPDEILTKIIIQKQKENEFARFYKIGARKAQSIAKASLCARAKIKTPSPLVGEGGGEGAKVIEDITISLGSVASTVVCAPKTEAFLKGKKLDSSIINEAKRLLSSEIKPIDDIRSTADYRRFVAGNLLARYLNELIA